MALIRHPQSERLAGYETGSWADAWPTESAPRSSRLWLAGRSVSSQTPPVWADCSIPRPPQAPWA